MKIGNATITPIFEVDADTLFTGAHFAEPIAGKIMSDGEGFKLV